MHRRLSAAVQGQGAAAHGPDLADPVHHRGAAAQVAEDGEVLETVGAREVPDGDFAAAEAHRGAGGGEGERGSVLRRCDGDGNEIHGWMVRQNAANARRGRCPRGY